MTEQPILLWFVGLTLFLGYGKMFDKCPVRIARLLDLDYELRRRASKRLHKRTLMQFPS